MDMLNRRWVRLVLLVALPLLAAACAAPVGAVRVNPSVVHRELTGSVLTTGHLSRFTQNVLFLQDLSRAFADDPDAAIAQLHGTVVAGHGGPDELFGLAELSFYRADALAGTPDWPGPDPKKARAHYLAAAIYAWAFLFPPQGARPPDPFDPRLRLAADLYNRGLTGGLASEDGATMELRAGTYALPWGDLEVSFDREELRWAGRELINFTPVAELKVQGLQARFRRPGIGAALAAGIAPVTAEDAVRDFVAPRAKVPATALLRFEEDLPRLTGPRVPAILELYPASERESIVIGGRTIPLELEPTAALAWALQEGPIWERELKGFLGSVFQVPGAPPQLISVTPYRPGLIPVVFVHGTASSAGRWAEMYNVLENDPVIRDRYQFWFFSYDSGQPIVYSSMLLRDALTAAVARLDPEGKDAALRQMVVIGHSQGGLLTKMTAVSTGTTLWDGVSQKPLDELTLTEETRTLLHRAFFVEPLPFVKRVVFISTPHRGSYLAASGMVTYIIQRLVSTPAHLVKGSAEVVANREAFAATLTGGSRLPTAVDNMSPRSPFVRTLSAIRVAQGIAADSIIAVQGTGPVADGGDGVVKYQSAHLEGVESEVVVQWEHSVQGQPKAIAEVRRLLRLHMGIK
jgi:pimeloyl-ACP methyl ester carboxylesterase